MCAKVVVCDKCGLCYGSQRALRLVFESAEENKNLVVKGALLHNERVLEELKKRGVGKKDSLKDFTKKDIFVVRAHGEPKSTFEYLDDNDIEFLDCTCPSVKAIHALVEIKSQEGYRIIIIGNRGKIVDTTDLSKMTQPPKIHAEIQGIMGWSSAPVEILQDMEDAENLKLEDEKYFLVVQTTYPQEKAVEIIRFLKEKIEKEHKVFEYRKTCCAAQKMINEESVKLAPTVDCMLVIGGRESNNTRELYNHVSEFNKNTYYVNNLSELKELKQQGILKDNLTYGLTAGASTMMESIEEVAKFLKTEL